MMIGGLVHWRRPTQRALQTDAVRAGAGREWQPVEGVAGAIMSAHPLKTPIGNSTCQQPGATWKRLDARHAQAPCSLREGPAQTEGMCAPSVISSPAHLEMAGREAARYLAEQRLLNLRKLVRLRHKGRREQRACVRSSVCLGHKRNLINWLRRGRWQTEAQQRYNPPVSGSSAGQDSALKLLQTDARTRFPSKATQGENSAQTTPPLSTNQGHRWISTKATAAYQPRPPLRTCVSSSTSSSSPRNSTSLCELVRGQNLSSERTTLSASRGSFSTNCGRGGAVHGICEAAARHNE